MAIFFVQRAAGFRLDDIYRYTKNQWGKAQADRYINGLFEHFQSIADQTAFSKPIPAILEVDGFVSRYEHHYVYWKHLDDGNVGIVTVLHERMHQIERLKDDFEDSFLRDRIKKRFDDIDGDDDMEFPKREPIPDPPSFES